MDTATAIFTGVLAFLAIGTMVIAFWQKKAWVFTITAIIWVVMGASALNGAESGTIIWALGIVGITVGLVLFLSPTWLRVKKEPKIWLDEDEEYSRRLDEETGKKKD